MSKNEFNPLCRRSSIVVQEYGSEILIYDLTINKAFSLNKTSALIWQACDGNKTVGEISRQLSRQLKSPVSENFVLFALDQLKNENLLEADSIASIPFEGLSRREVIRKVGFASLIALPVIASLIAPTAVQAQSAGGCFGDNNLNRSALGCTCNSASDCVSGCCGRTAGSNICVTPALDANGSECRAACECAGNCCAGNTCFTEDAFPKGTPCVSACQCLNTCSGGVCT